MLNVPDKIKELFHMDSVNKNIRIHFPNGERTDICNDQIRKDTVEFKESLCSQSTLKFGLCESPIFQCEVFGVSNVKGAVIEVYCEIYCDSDVQDAVWQNDLEHYVYQIPYGRFLIQSSKRQADMIHRQIIAYNSNNINDLSPSKSKISKEESSASAPFYVEAKNQETVKNYIIRQHSGDYSYDIVKRMFARINKIDNITSKEAHGLSTTTNPYNGISVDAGRIWFHTVNMGYKLDQTMTDVFYFEPQKSEYTVDDIWAWVEEQIAEMTQRANLYGKSGRIPYYNKLKEYIHIWLYEGMNIVPQMAPDIDSFPPAALFSLNGYVWWDGQTTSGQSVPFSCAVNDDHVVVYPKNTTGNSSKDSSSYVYYVVPYMLEIEDTMLYPSGGTPYFDYLYLRNSSEDYPRYQKAYKLNNPRFGIERTQKRISAKLYFTDVYYYVGYALNGDCDDSFWQKVITSYYELMGCFAFMQRNNELTAVNIKQQFGLTPETNLYPSNQLYPEGVTGGKLLPQDYQSCWYDDDYTKPFGSVSINYKNTNDQDCQYLLFLTGYDESIDENTYQSYEVQGNEIITSGKWTETVIAGICDDIASNIEGVTYMPVEFVGRGLPYVEAGDTFEILTKSNDSITTIVLNRTIKGEQHLVDSYKSV